MERNREGYLVGEGERECTACRTVFTKTSLTVTLCHACNSHRVISQDAETKMYRRAKSRAKNKGIEFSLTRGDISIPNICPILGISLNTHKGRSGGYNDSPALDRIDNSKGYTKDNIWVISHLANKMKADASVEELRKFGEWVLSLKGRDILFKMENQVCG